MTIPDDGEQLEFFEELPKVEAPEWKPDTTCAKCKHILAVKFQNRNLFFCSIAESSGKYGRKIKKNQPNCRDFNEATRPSIPQWDGYYGGYSTDGVNRE